MIRPRSSSPATAFAVAFLDELIRCGIRDIVISPGSRSQAIALAAAEFDRLGVVRLRVRTDERVAGFLALGLAVETQRPVVVVTTSGTAVANLHPAVLEAHHSGVPLIVVSADRPTALRGTGANQTTQQPGIFSIAVAANWDIAAPIGAAGETDAAATVAHDAWLAAATGAPVHVNLAFTEPLSGPLEIPESTAEWDEAPLPRELEPIRLELEPHPGTVVIAGAGAGERAEQTARALGVPLFAEISSGAHFGPNLVVAYRELLNTANFGDRIERVIVFGHPTLSREVPALIQRQGVTTIVVRSAGADDFNPGRAVQHHVDDVTVAAVHSGPADRSWLGRWVSASRELLAPPAEPTAAELDAAAFARRELAAVRAPIDRAGLVDAVWRATWPHDRLILGASRLIREADRVLPGKKVRVHANRGLAGIDGTIATAIGIALGAIPDPNDDSVAQRHGTTRVLLGDLAALHDAGAMLFGRGEIVPRLQVIVGNDGGGTIFDGLEVAATADREAFDRVMFTPHSADFSALATAFGWAYVRASNRGELDQALTATASPVLIEVPLPR